MRKQKTTHIARIRKAYAWNQQHIRAAFGWSEDTCNNQWLDMGHAFLEGHYPVKDAKYAGYHRMIAADWKFWNWWLAEWKQQEAYCLRLSGKANVVLTPKYYRVVMSCLLDDGRVETSFFNHYIYKLKSIKNGSNSDRKQTEERSKHRQGTARAVQVV